jgi:hypothetical protein
VSWSVGKTMVGLGGPTTERACKNERRAQYELCQVLRQLVESYEVVMAKSDPHGWYGALLKLRRMADQLETGKWPVGGEGLNWLWSLPWGSGITAERDLWIFWAKCDGSGGAGDSDTVEPVGPTGGLKRELEAIAA